MDLARMDGSIFERLQRLEVLCARQEAQLAQIAAIIAYWREQGLTVSAGDIAPPLMPEALPSTGGMRAIALRHCEANDLLLEDLRGPSRRGMVSEVRQMAMLEMHEAGFSQGQIGRFLGGRDHTTIGEGIRQAQRRRAQRREAAISEGSWK